MTLIKEKSDAKSMYNFTWKDIEKTRSKNDFLIKVTPSETIQSKKSLNDIAKHISLNIQRIRFIVASEAKTKIFDKALGQAWLLVEPIIIAWLYFFITTIVFEYTGEKKQFLFILTSVVFWRWFSRTIDGSPLSIVGYSSVLKQTRFPVLVIVMAFMATEMFFFAISVLVLIVFLFLYGYYPNWMYIYLPLVLATQFSFMLFLTVIFSIIGTFFKDLSGLLYALTGVWWYLSPGIYPVSKIPQDWLWLYMLNPFAHILPAYRNIFIDNISPPLLPLLIILTVFAIFSGLAIKLFNKARYYFFAFL